MKVAGLRFMSASSAHPASSTTARTPFAEPHHPQGGGEQVVELRDSQRLFSGGQGARLRHPSLADAHATTASLYLGTGGNPQRSHHSSSEFSAIIPMWR